MTPLRNSGKMLRQKLGDRVLGPVQPNIARIRGYYAQDIMLKLEKSAPLLSDSKAFIRHSTEMSPAPANPALGRCRW